MLLTEREQLFSQLHFITSDTNSVIIYSVTLTLLWSPITMSSSFFCVKGSRITLKTVKKWVWMEAFKIRKRRLKLHRIIIEVVIEVVYNLCTIFHKYYVRNRQKLKSVLTDDLLMWVVNCSIETKFFNLIWQTSYSDHFCKLDQPIHLWINVKRSDSKKIIWH